MFVCMQRLQTSVAGSLLYYSFRYTSVKQSSSTGRTRAMVGEVAKFCSPEMPPGSDASKTDDHRFAEKTQRGLWSESRARYSRVYVRIVVVEPLPVRA